MQSLINHCRCWKILPVLAGRTSDGYPYLCWYLSLSFCLFFFFLYGEIGKLKRTFPHAAKAWEQRGDGCCLGKSLQLFWLLQSELFEDAAGCLSPSHAQNLECGTSGCHCRGRGCRQRSQGVNVERKSNGGYCKKEKLNCPQRSNSLWGCQSCLCGRNSYGRDFTAADIVVGFQESGSGAWGCSAPTKKAQNS